MATTAVLNLGINTKQASKSLKGITSELSNFTKFAIGGLAIAGGAVAVGLGVASFKLIKLGSDAEETANKFNSVFSSMQTTANETARTLANAYGLSRKESNKLLGDTGDLLTGFGFTQASALDLSNQVQQLAVDLASFQNLTGGASDASSRITKALTGEVESLKALGVVIRQDTKGFKDSVSAIQARTGATLLQAKAQVILSEITKQSKNALGDYAKTSKMFANQLRLTSAIWDDLTVGIGLFLKDILGAESGLLSFNNTFRTVTDNTLGFLSNWRENFKITTDWISDNFSTLFLVDIPNIFGTLIKNSIHNFAEFGKIIATIFVLVGDDIGSSISDAFLKTLPKVLIESFKGIVKWGKSVGNVVKKVLTGDFDIVSTLLVDRLTKGLAFIVTGGKTKNLAEKVASAIKTGVDQSNFKTNLLEGLELKSGAIEFNLKTNDQFQKDIEDAKKAIEGDSGELGKKTQQPQQLQDAVIKGSIEAFKLENTPQAKLQQKQYKEQKKQTKELEKQTKNQAKTVNLGDL
jgi:hypothetical protein